ncbi:hypothetical protein DXG03_008381 [Asterophora parasitica]|uniref:Uncharacterized protein n=1 Tax=Asterophora parasitica TaxID=117018 RepID=A0A9P7G040_9AGAR|nr:hypothetical protein DXG03_008381 [Asterophora parasitica]
MSTVPSSSLATLPRPKPDLSHTRRPKSSIGIFFWRCRMWFEATFVLSMLEPWEKIIILTIFLGTVLLVMTGLVKYLPEHISIMQRRAMYYLWGQEGDERLLWQWLGVSAAANVAEGAPGLYKEL